MNRPFLLYGWCNGKMSRFLTENLRASEATGIAYRTIDAPRPEEVHSVTARASIRNRRLCRL
jgi:hypothetical protein